MSENIILVGMMGSGKSSVGRVLQNILKNQYTHLDTDLYIQRKEQKTIEHIFSEKGEGYFRKQENELLSEIPTTKTVLSTGGGLPFYLNNWELLNQLGTVFFLSHPFGQLLSNIEKSSSKRPLFDQKTFKKLYEQRVVLYSKAQFTINCKGKHQTQIAKEIISIMSR